MEVTFSHCFTSLVLVSCLFASLFSPGCATTPRHGPYSVVVARDPSRHHLIDDFRSQKLENKIGGVWSTEGSPGAKLDLSFFRDDALKPHGLCLKLDYDIPRKGAAALVGGLNQLDISQAEAFSFWIKSEHDLRQLLFVELRRANGDVFTLPLAKKISKQKNVWQEVLIQRKEWALFPLDELDSFRLVIRADGDAMKDTLFLDHVVFSGAPDLFFHSLGDNVRALDARLLNESRRKELAQFYRERMLTEIAKDTWGYFRDLVDKKSHLPLNFVRLGERPRIGDYTSPTDVAMYFLACLSAEQFRWIKPEETRERIAGTLATLLKLPRWEGFFYNYYNTTNLQVTDHFVSSVDNAWLAAALIAVRQAVPNVQAEASKLLEEMDFSVFYDESVGQFRLGYDDRAAGMSPHHYGLLSSETRIISYVAIGKEDVEERHWFRLYRTLPKEWDWQNQAPRGEEKIILGQTVFEGYYVYGDMPIVPSWGGALFEFLMPTLLMNEMGLAPKGLGLNAQHAVRVHIHAARIKNYPVWGLSPCAFNENLTGGYGEFGVGEIGAKGYPDKGIVTPHVTFLALPVLPDEAIQNVRTMIERYEMYGPYGLYDSVDVKRSTVCHHYLALDQGMTLAALTNFLKDGYFWKLFHADPAGARPEPLVAIEEFYPGHTAA